MFSSINTAAGTHSAAALQTASTRRTLSGSLAQKSHGPLASQLKDIRQRTHMNLQPQLRKSIPPANLTEVCSLIDEIESGEASFESIAEQVNGFIQQNKNNPEVIESTLKYLNSQLMMLSGAERHLKAEIFPVQQSLHDSVDALLFANGGTGEAMLQQLADTTISPVFTAHPTNFNKPEASAIVLSQLDDISTPHGNAKICNELWDAQGVRQNRPSVQEEAQHFSSNVRHLHSSGRSIHKQINQKLASLPNSPVLSRPLVEAGNWVGGDRDGNPNIDANVLKDVVKTLSTAAFDHLQQKIGTGKTPRSGLASLLGKAGCEQQLEQIQNKLARTREHLVGSSELPIQGDLYLSANDMLLDLQALDTSSLGPDEQTQLTSKMQLLKLDVESIGFHGASTDIRQNSAMNEKTVGELLRRSGLAERYEALSEPEKENLLTNLLMDNTVELAETAPAGGAANPEFDREIELIKSYKTIHDTYGPQALKNCITANTESLSDMLEVMLLLKHAGLAGDKGLQMNVIPLIETVNDLHNGPAILKSMLEHPWYSKALEKSGRPQQIMVGYSDSNRLDGPLPSSWAVYEGTAKMAEVAAEQGVKLHVFHGRGGTEARGSGDSYKQEIRSGNGASLQTGMRQTEQGEEVPAKFGTKSLSKSSLADMVSSTLDSMSKGADPHLPTYADTMGRLAEHARNSYQSLYQDPALPTFFQTSTPIEFVGRSNAGSRPASRANSADGGLNLDKLRAIPWVGAWYQSGTVMPAYYGTGTALKNFVESGEGAAATPAQGMAHLQTMYKDWPFFRSFIDRTATAMEKADMKIAREYAKLAPAHAQGVFSTIEAEYALSKAMILDIKKSSDLMEHHPVNGEIMEVKKPLTQAAHAMQIGLLKAYQEAGPEIRERLTNPIVMSMQAIASANRFG